MNLLKVQRADIVISDEHVTHNLEYTIRQAMY